MTFTAAIALAAVLAYPTSAVRAKDYVPSLYTADNEPVQVTTKEDD